MAKIHPDISKLIALRELVIHGNLLRLLPPEFSQLEELENGSGYGLQMMDNPWILPIKQHATLGTSHVMKYISSSTYKIVYERNK